MVNKDNTTIEQQPSVNKNSDINFIYKKLKTCHPVQVTHWINNDEFATKIRALKSQSITITDRMIYDIMRDIYFSELKKWKDTGIKPEFSLYHAKQCIKNLHRLFTGSQAGWNIR